VRKVPLLAGFFASYISSGGMILKNIRQNGRLKVAALHFFISSTVGLIAALIVFLFWYPYPYRDISGGKVLFCILMAVDVVAGPICTLAIFNTKKSKRELLFDFGVLGFVQAMALGYGLWAVYQARPLHIVFEYSLFRIVHANEIPDQFLKKIPKEFLTSLLQSPTQLSLRPFYDAREQLNATSLAFEGVSLSVQPELWQAYELSHSKILAEAKPMADLKSRFPKSVREIDGLLATLRRNEESLVYIPLTSRGTFFWTTILDAGTAEIVGFLPLDSF
jgi:hypothetical protein